MTHLLNKRHHLHAVGDNPMVVSLRYRCECATAEVFTISVVLDRHVDEQKFMWTMLQLWRDTQFEVEQHIKNATTPGRGT